MDAKVIKIVKFIIFIWHLPIAYPTLLIYQIYLIRKIGEEGNPQDLIDADDADKLQDLLEPYCDSFIKKHKTIINSMSLVFWLTILRFVIF